MLQAAVKIRTRYVTTGKLVITLIAIVLKFLIGGKTKFSTPLRLLHKKHNKMSLLP